MTPPETQTSENPLLEAPGFPRFDTILPEHVEPAINTLIDRLESAFAEFEGNVQPTWEGLIEPLERMQDELTFHWNSVSHLVGVKNSDELRTAHEAVQPRIVEVSMRIAQSRAVYTALEALVASDGYANLDSAQKRIAESMLRDAKLAGVGLEGEEKERFNAIQMELADLSSKFGNHVLDATKAWSLTLKDKAQVEGLPESLLQMASAAAEAAGETSTPEAGPWRITLDIPCLVPFLKRCRDRDLRAQVHRAFVTRASEGELDNTPLIERTLELRAEQAKLLGFENFAALSLSRKMAQEVSAVEELFEQLLSTSRPAAEREVEEVRAFARAKGAPEADDLKPSDMAYWGEELRQERFDYDEEELRPYFPMPRVLEGLFSLTQRLFGVEVRSADGEVPVWQEDVRFFRIHDGSGAEIASFYLDPYSRPAEKRGGAWMADCLGRNRLFPGEGGGQRLPVAFLTCNGTPPQGDKPSLMTFREVETLFHEFGHGLQHMLTRVDHGPAAGISGVEWDAVELPSQFMENWCYHRETLMGLTSHVDTGEPLPDADYEKICAARTFHAGLMMLRQLHFGMTDMELHNRGKQASDATAHDVARRMSERTTVVAPIPEDRFLCAFAHIFAGSYCAGYFSYKWAEVLSADAFAAFEEAGLENTDKVAELGLRFRETVLALGGSKAPMDVFVEFRGRKPSSEALLRHSGLSA